MVGGLLMAGDLLFPFHSNDKLFLVSEHGYYNNWFYSAVLRETPCMKLGFSPEKTAVY